VHPFLAACERSAVGSDDFGITASSGRKKTPLVPLPMIPGALADLTKGERNRIDSYIDILTRPAPELGTHERAEIAST
jgi:hypothetical protein